VDDLEDSVTPVKSLVKELASDHSATILDEPSAYPIGWRFHISPSNPDAAPVTILVFGDQTLLEVGSKGAHVELDTEEGEPVQLRRLLMAVVTGQVMEARGPSQTLYFRLDGRWRPHGGISLLPRKLRRLRAYAPYARKTG